jgi:hypothetical protein
VSPQLDVTRAHQQQHPVTHPGVTSYAAKVARGATAGADSSAAAAAAPGANGAQPSHHSTLSIADPGSESLVDAVCVLQSPPGLSLPEVGAGALSGSSTVVVAEVLAATAGLRSTGGDQGHHHPGTTTTNSSSNSSSSRDADTAGPPGLGAAPRACDVMGVTSVMSGDMSDPPGLQSLTAAAEMTATQHADEAAASGEQPAGCWNHAAMLCGSNHGPGRAAVLCTSPMRVCSARLLQASARLSPPTPPCRPLPVLIPSQPHPCSICLSQ